MMWSYLLGKIYGEPVKCELAYRKVYKYLDRYMRCKNIDRSRKKQNEKVKENKTIWILWFQGMTNAPKLVRYCYESVRRNKPEDFDLVVLTSDNIGDYVEFPSYIWEKYQKGIITKTHFSDILRVEVLSSYGGCWIDATVYCSEPIPSYLLSGDLFFFRGSVHNVSVLKGSSWWIYSRKDLPFLCDLRNVLYAYWEKEKCLKNYYLFHIIFARLLNENAGAYGGMLGKMPYVNNSNSHVLHGKLGAKYDKEVWQIVKSISPVHKLSYKQKHIQGDLPTFYMALIENKLV